MHDIEARISRAYEESGNTMGWRFLSSPVQTLQEARVAFIGLNPGGSKEDSSHGKFAMKEGSAYRDESWADNPPGESKLQKQILSLFDRLGEKPENVLSGNLVPFRSPDWNSLKRPRSALKFGEDLWLSVLRDAKPSLVVTMGSLAIDSVCRLLQVRDVRKTEVGWGSITACKGRFNSGIFVGLPHLSRFGIMNRPESAPYLDALFADDV
ncbi:uracil DNA glycosylase superfamily protein [Hoeflea sp. IMCC20628]|uniref:uracil-DNA glycosylase family protein n=1 Tax=Hoeflea sp. IMCC20628 TaxID=1620421 RepID=UPI00063A8E20|nr:uracil-DNA glycosylase family protein [Hoeflea sp. IMCC20628]AKI02240.1 uracil DNA glycosylase superfamily protein [Hoeflea sp. IMCC20628]